MTREMVLVEWLDSRGSSGTWVEEGDGMLDLGPCLIVSCGFLIKDDDKHIVIALNIADDHSDDRQFDGLMFIPRVSILEIKRLDVQYENEIVPE